MATLSGPWLLARTSSELAASVRADAFRKHIEKEGLTQAETAKRLKVSQPRVSDLKRGKISRFSLDTLVNMLTDAGIEVAVKIKPRARRVA